MVPCSIMPLMKKLHVLLLLLLLLIAACEPLAPNGNQQGAVIVVTNTPTAPGPITLTPPLTTALPTRVLPTSTPTVFQPPTPTVEPCDEPTGRVISNVMFSQLIGGEVDYRVYVPPCFFQTLRRYPYVILLHGSGYNYTQWTTDLGVQEIMDARIFDTDNPLPPMVLVMPEGGDLQEINFFESGSSFENLILDELMPEIERQFCVWASPEGRAIGGISRGGFWALSIAFRNPDSFSAVGAHSPGIFEDNAPSTHNPLDLAFSVSADIPLRIFIDNPRSDLAADNIIALSNTLRSNNVQHTYEISPSGTHDNEYWAAHLDDYLNFYGDNWPTDPASYPSCFE